MSARAAISIHTKGQVSAQRVVEGIKDNNIIVAANTANKQTVKQACDVIWHGAPCLRNQPLDLVFSRLAKEAREQTRRDPQPAVIF